MSKLFNLFIKNSSKMCTYEDINAAYRDNDTYAPFLSWIEESDVTEPFKGPFCMYCKSNQHLGRDCERKLQRFSTWEWVHW